LYYNTGYYSIIRIFYYSTGYYATIQDIVTTLGPNSVTLIAKLSYGSEIWIFNQRESKELEMAEILFHTLLLDFIIIFITIMIVVVLYLYFVFHL
jgi:hypothetical protein